jgi:pantoate--beta-alanine ligase
LRIGFVPTMGALHMGHIALFEQAKKSCDIVVGSIFVNPIQFNDPADFAKYPKTVERDLEMLADAACDYVYLPSVEEMYPEGMSNTGRYDLGPLEEMLEGEHRPGHFQGVCAVVHRLLETVMPDVLFMGKKDYQQVAVIRQLLKLVSFQQHIELIACDTIREKSGLAMSSRNARLSEKQKIQATAIYQGFLSVRRSLDEGYRSDPDPLDDQFRQSLQVAGFEKVDYVAFCDPQTLISLNKLNQTFVLLVAATIGGVRLIDNHTFEL